MENQLDEQAKKFLQHAIQIHLTSLRASIGSSALRFMLITYVNEPNDRAVFAVASQEATDGETLKILDMAIDGTRKAIVLQGAN